MLIQRMLSRHSWKHPGSGVTGSGAGGGALSSKLTAPRPGAGAGVGADTPAEQAVGVASLDLLQDREGFTWKGHERLSPRWDRCPGQRLPATPLSSSACHQPPSQPSHSAEWGLVAFGTSHGFGLFDYLRRSPVLARWV